jgi:hypothetical protein
MLDRLARLLADAAQAVDARLPVAVKQADRRRLRRGARPSLRERDVQADC